MLIIEDLLKAEHLNNTYKDSPKYRNYSQSMKHNIILNIFCPLCGDFIKTPNIFKRAIVFNNLKEYSTNFWMHRPIVCKICANLR